MSANKDVRVIYLSPYVPRECGIATFTKQIVDVMHTLSPKKFTKVVAVDDSNKSFDYPKEVELVIKYNDKQSYIKAAKYINQSDAEVVSIQHEFGLYGENSGENILDFVNHLEKPFIVTFHTILSNPDEVKKNIIKKISQKAAFVIVMADEAIKRMVEIYRIQSEKILKIPHGVPDIPRVSTRAYKNNLGIIDSNVISTFGLISPNKGIEYVIKAMPEILCREPKTHFLIIGKTHPNIQLQFGEDYRNSLIDLAKKLNVDQNVRFINKFLSLEEIIYYLQATDIYITPYLEPEQITSGTLAYALGAGKTCISTPYAYAKEVLAKNRGCLVPFRDSAAISAELMDVLLNKQKRNDLSKNSYSYGRKMIWENIGKKYQTVFQELSK